MTLQLNGQIALSDIIGETNTYKPAGYSLDNGENGQTNLGYPKINLCSTYKPSDNDGCSLSEWWGYNHYQQCNLYRWTAVYNDTQTNLCNSNPTNTPPDTAVPSGCIERVDNAGCVCIGADPQIVGINQDYYDGRSGKLLFLNYYNNVYNIIIYNLAGQQIWSQSTASGVSDGNGYYINGSLSLTGLAVATYVVSFQYRCYGSVGGNYCIDSYANLKNEKFLWQGSVSVGSTSPGTPTYYSQDTSGTVACATTNQIRMVYYTISSTANSADINTYFYLDYNKTIIAPAGAYVMANGKKYIVDSTGKVTSVTATCTASGGMFGKYFRRNFMVLKFFSSQSIVVGSCYLLENRISPSTCYVRGTVTSYNSSTGVIEISSYTGDCV
jgi:hypothetical protein